MPGAEGWESRRFWFGERIESLAGNRSGAGARNPNLGGARAGSNLRAAQGTGHPHISPGGCQGDRGAQQDRRNQKHEKQWLQTLEAYVFPHIGHVRANEITGPMIRNALADIRLAKPETARRVRQRIGTVLHWTYASDYRQTEAPMRAITKGLPRQPKQEGHFAAMPLPAWARMFSSRLATGCLSDCASPRTSTACRSTVRPRPSSSKAGRASG